MKKSEVNERKELWNRAVVEKCEMNIFEDTDLTWILKTCRMIDKMPYNQRELMDKL